jgi:hypothetical protein
MQTSQFIEELASGNASVAKDILNDMLSTRAFESLDVKKIELARNMFNGSEVQEEELELSQEEYYQIGELLVNENIEIDEETMTHIQLKKAPGTSGNVTHVHYKGKQIGSITKNKPSGMVRDAQTGAVRKATLGGHPGANKISYSTKHKSGETSSGHGDVKKCCCCNKRCTR